MSHSALLTAAFLAAAAATSPALADPAFQGRLDDKIAELVGADEPGIAACVASDKRIEHLSARGFANVEKRLPMTVDTPVYIASVAKGFTAVAILKLVEEKRLSLDDRAATFLPGLPAYMAPVTIRQLLAHTAGVPDYDDAFASGGDVTNAEVMSFLRNQKALTNPAGSAWSYSNAGYVVLAELFGAVAKESLDRYVTRTFFAPNGMTSSFFLTARTRGRARAVGYAKKGNDWVRADYNALTIGPGGVYSSARDMCKWGLALDSGKVLKRMTLIAAYTPHVASVARPTPMGLGFQVEDIANGPLKGEWYAALFGNRDGFRAVDMRLKSRPFRYVQLSNSSRELEPMQIPNLYFEQR